MENRDFIINEQYIPSNPILLSIEGINRVVKQMNQSICKIYVNEKKEGTGFFLKFPDKIKNKFINALFTNNHILDENELKNKKSITISIYLDNKVIFKEISLYNSRYFTNPKLDITIIELEDSQCDKDYEFLELDENIEQEIKNLNKIYKTLYILQYPKEENIIASFGLFKAINKQNEIHHNCCTDLGSSGSPILSLKTNKVIGIHKGKHERYDLNTGTLLNNIQNLFFGYPNPKILKKKINIYDKYHFNDGNNQKIDTKSKSAIKNDNGKNNIDNLHDKLQEVKKPNINKNLIDNKIGLFTINDNINTNNKGIIDEYALKNNYNKSDCNILKNNAKEKNTNNYINGF